MEHVEGTSLLEYMKNFPGKRISEDMVKAIMK
jgi:hypothetical protein